MKKVFSSVLVLSVVLMASSVSALAESTAAASTPGQTGEKRDTRCETTYTGTAAAASVSAPTTAPAESKAGAAKN
jgi:hypothetical protein